MMTGPNETSNDEEKLAALNFANDCVLNFSAVLSGLQSQNPFQQLEVKSLKKEGEEDLV